MTTPFQDNQKQNRFEYHVENDVVFANYRKEGDKLYIDYVEAPVQLRGSGAAGKLMQYVMDTARENHFKEVIPICGYAASWLRRHPEYNDLTSL